MINKEELLKIDLTQQSELVIDPEFRAYFIDTIGNEHYMLLAYFSTKYNSCSLLDIGSYKGCSALALSYNNTNKVVSFDIRPGLKRLHKCPDNVEFIVGDVMDPSYLELVLSSPFILLDTYHDGIFEKAFYDYLKQNKYSGILMLDDIKLNKEMMNFWEGIDNEKLDVSEFGHHSGTGLVMFK